MGYGVVRGTKSVSMVSFPAIIGRFSPWGNFCWRVAGVFEVGPCFMRFRGVSGDFSFGSAFNPRKTNRFVFAYMISAYTIYIVGFFSVILFFFVLRDMTFIFRVFISFFLFPLIILLVFYVTASPGYLLYHGLYWPLDSEVRVIGPNVLWLDGTKMIFPRHGAQDVYNVILTFRNRQ